MMDMHNDVISLYFWNKYYIFILLSTLNLKQVQKYFFRMSFQNGSFYYQHSGNQSNMKQKSINKQKLIQDQNYSTQMFFGMMSTLQSLVRYYNNTHQSQFNNKMFSAYDRVNYSSKSLLELKSQLKTQIFLNQASQTVFAQENPTQVWTLPINFDANQVKSFLDHSLAVFQAKYDQESYHMTKDIQSILFGKLSNLNSEKMQFDLKYSQEEMKTFKSSLVDNGMFSAQQMDRRQEEANKLNEVSDINAKVHHQFSPFHQGEIKNQSSGHLSQQKQLYLVFQARQDIPIRNTLQKCFRQNQRLDIQIISQGCKIYDSKENISRQANHLKFQGFINIIRIIIDQNGLIKQWATINELRL